MKVTSAEFIKSAFKETDWLHDNLREIAFLGRSNVGKSSLINSLLGVRGLARTSSTPGRTQSLNFYLINQQFRFVDLPGYGYARAPKTIKAEWGKAAGDYLAQREQLVLSIHIVDSRHEPSKQDLQLHEWLKHHQKPHLIVATKADKLSNNELRKNMDRIARAFNSTQVLIYSATERRGRDQLWGAIEKSLKR
ncbi:MAG: YihA family ribosome biogenesis GTP-binding protein [Acidobacteria bacterium]|nr:MAG: YihA family ribosome biogenesis GTP-binding protein [Acidobacteriota bacterium]